MLSYHPQPAISNPFKKFSSSCLHCHPEYRSYSKKERAPVLSFISGPSLSLDLGLVDCIMTLALWWIQEKQWFYRLFGTFC
jgi:hypothetical protein